MIIHDMVRHHAVVIDKQRTADYIERHKAEPFHLPMSGMARCVRQTYLGTFLHKEGHPLQRDVTHPFSTKLLIKFEHGRMYERQLHLEILSSVDDSIVRHEPSLGDDVWSGKPDFVFEPSGNLPEGLIVDCKATGEYVFAYTMGRIPRLADALQVLMYQRFMQLERPAYKWPAKLYYRGWGHWGEFEIEDDSLGIFYNGFVNGHEVSGSFATSLDAEMERVDRWWQGANAEDYLDRMADPVFAIQGYSSPFDATFGCLRKNGKRGWAACRWLSVCWPQFEAGNDGPFTWPDKEEEEVF